MRDLHELPKLRDSLSYLYLERCRIEQKHKAVEFIDQEGRTMIPAAALSVLLLGPGTSITHAAVKSRLHRARMQLARILRDLRPSGHGRQM